jgi:hypothetical protein
MKEQVKQALDQSTTRFLTALTRLLPGLVALVVALLISVVLAWIVAIAMRRLLVSLKFDQRLVQWGFPSPAEGSLIKSPSVLLSQFAAALVVMTGLLIGVSAFDAELTSLLVRSVFSYVPNILGATLVLLVGNIIARFLARSILIGSVNLNFQHGRLLSVGVKWLVIVLAVAMALEHLRIASGIVELAFGILFGGIVLALALAVAFNSKELVTRSLERDAPKTTSETLEDPLRHL